MEKKFVCNRLKQVRYAFIFPCFTDLAFGDMCNLTQKNLVRADWIPFYFRNSIGKELEEIIQIIFSERFISKLFVE